MASDGRDPSVLAQCPGPTLSEAILTWGFGGKAIAHTFPCTALGVSKGMGRGPRSLRVGAGQVKQAEVRGWGPPSPRECLDDVTLGAPQGGGELVAGFLSSPSLGLMRD